MSSTTPNMGLTQPTVGVDTGVTWESAVNSNSTLIDQHNHASGNGVPITPSGMSINAPLSFGNFPATGLAAAEFQAQPSLATLKAIYVVGNDLYYNDGAGNIVQMTSGGAVNATSSGISSGTASAAFSSGVLIVNAAANTPANVRMASALLGNNTSGSKFLTLSPPSAMAANITETLPTIPAVISFMQMDTSGNMAASVPVAGTNLQVLQMISGVATWSSFQAPSVQTLTSSGTYSVPTGTLYIKVQMIGGGGGGGGNSTNGSGGATTTFSNWTAAAGGNGFGSTASNAGAGGTCSTNTTGTGVTLVNTVGGDGGSGGVGYSGGNGGAGYFGSGGRSISVNNGGTVLTSANAGNAPGSGGGGGGGAGTYNAGGGSAGGYLEFLITALSASYSYSVGGGGGGGGTSSSVGGAGAAGTIVVTAYFQ